MLSGVELESHPESDEDEGIPGANDNRNRSIPNLENLLKKLPKMICKCLVSSSDLGIGQAIEDSFHEAKNQIGELKGATKEGRKSFLAQIKQLSKYKVIYSKLVKITRMQSSEFTLQEISKTLHFLVYLKTDLLTEAAISFLLEECLLKLGLDYEFCSLHKASKQKLKLAVKAADQDSALTDLAE